MATKEPFTAVPWTHLMIYLKSALTGLAFAIVAALACVAVCLELSFSIASQLPGYWEFDWTRFPYWLLHLKSLWVCAVSAFGCGFYWMFRRLRHRLNA